VLGTWIALKKLGVTYVVNVDSTLPAYPEREDEERAENFRQAAVEVVRKGWVASGKDLYLGRYPDDGSRRSRPSRRRESRS
jgi:hypothetical protein